MEKILKYLEAVRKRKCIDGQGRVNFAIAKQLEEDILILAELVEKGLECLDRSDTLSYSESLDILEEVAKKGSTARWGDCERKEPNVPAKEKKDVRLPPAQQGRATEI